ncbi:MAG: GTP cyclohydrolase FolE2 [Pseudomonadota bacterium]
MASQPLPDVVSDSRAETPLTLEWVGMEGIAVPLRVAGTSLTTVQAKADVFVALDAPQAKGIHMSRLYALVTGLADLELTQGNLETVLQQAIASQQGIGHSAKLALSFELTLRKPALLSGESGFQSYPVVLHAKKLPDSSHYAFDITIPYSSTCPCSAALTRQLYADAIDAQFPGDTVDKSALLRWAQSLDGSVATPHSQRSYAYLHLSFDNDHWPDLSTLIRDLEHTLGTAVQTAVKRPDEQEFARLNGENLMFCEDAARRLKAVLEDMPHLSDYWFKVEHRESLHAHNAVAMDSKSRGVRAA